MASLTAEAEKLHRTCSDGSCMDGKCRRGSCSVRLSAEETVAIIDCDECRCFSGNDSRPDFIILGESGGCLRFAIVEFKGRLQHPKSLQVQLQAGADTVGSCRRFRMSKSPAKPIPVVIHSRGGRTADYEVLRSQRVTHRGKRYPILAKRCGYVLGFS